VPGARHREHVLVRLGLSRGQRRLAGYPAVHDLDRPHRPEAVGVAAEASDDLDAVAPTAGRFLESVLTASEETARNTRTSSNAGINTTRGQAGRSCRSQRKLNRSRDGGGVASLRQELTEPHMPPAWASELHKNARARPTRNAPDHARDTLPRPADPSRRGPRRHPTTPPTHSLRNLRSRPAPLAHCPSSRTRSRAPPGPVIGIGAQQPRARSCEVLLPDRHAPRRSTLRRPLMH
jgi:hypothetical protein